MTILGCVCGLRLTGETREELFAAMRAHSDAVHTDYTISDDEIAQMLDAQERMTPWDGTPRTLAAPPAIRRLAPGDADAFIGFFDRDAFMDNPGWAGCYCMFYHCAADGWDARGARENRPDKRELIAAGKARGLMAYDGDGKPIAWCHAAPRSELPGLAHVGVPWSADSDLHVGSIVCFVVSAPYRRQGVAAALLDAACDALRDAGMTVAEAYPPHAAASDARAFRGPLGMYEAAGFARTGEEGERYVAVRKTL